MTQILYDLYHEQLDNLDLSVSDRKDIYSLGSTIQRCFWDYNDNIADIKIRNLYSFIQEYLKQSNIDNSDNRAIKRFVSAFTKINKDMPIAGMVLLNADRTRVMLVRNYKSRSWSFPKGKIEIFSNEKPQECAYRECIEETNYNCESNKLLGMVSENICGRMTYFYIVDGVPEDYKFSCDNPYEIEELGWHDFDDN